MRYRFNIIGMFTKVLGGCRVQRHGHLLSIDDDDLFAGVDPDHRSTQSAGTIQGH